MGSGRPAPNQVDYKPPWSPHPTQSPMLQTTTRQKKASDPARRLSKASILPDPSRTVKTSATKSTQYHPSSSSEYIHKPSSSRANYPTSYGHDPGDSRSSSSRHPEPKSSKSKTPKSSFDHFTSPMSPNAALAMPYNGWLPPVSKTTDPSVRKSSKSKDRDRDKDTYRGRERDRTSDTHARKTSRELSRDPYESRQQIHHSATLGRDLKERQDENAAQPKPSGHRRHLTEDDTMTLKSPRPGENNRPTILPSQPPTQSSSAAQPQYPDQGRGLATPIATNKYSPPPAPLVAPVWLPQRSKSKEKTKAGQEILASGSDTERENRGLRVIRGDGSQETLAPTKPKKESKMSLAGWFTRKAPRPVIGSPIMPTPASHLFSPLPETVLPPPHLISLHAGQGPSDPPFPYDSTNKTPGIAGRTLNALDTFTKKHHRSQSTQPTASSSRPSASGHDPLRSQTTLAPQTPVIGTYTPSRSHTTPFLGVPQTLYPDQSLRSGYGNTQDVRTYSTDTIRSPPSGQANGHDPNHPPTAYPKDSYTGRNRSKDSVGASQTGSVSGTVKSKRKPVPLHNIFPDGTVEYTTPLASVPAPAPVQPQTHDTPVPDVHHSKRDSMAPIPIPPPQPRSAPANGSFSTITPVVTTGLLGEEPQTISAVSNSSHPGLSVADIYPAGYATVGKQGERLGKDREKERRKERKRRKDKGSPPNRATDGEHAMLTAKDSPLLATPMVTTISGSSHVTGLFEVNGVSSTNVLPDVSPNPQLEQQAQDQGPRPRPISGVGSPAPQNHSLQVPSPQHRSNSHQSSISPNSQPPSQRPSPKPSPTGSYLTVPNHSNQPSPVMKNGNNDARIQQDGPGTPSSSSTVMMSTPPINFSRVTLKDVKSTHSYSPARKDDQLYPHSGSHAVGKGSTGTVDTVADPRTYERGYGKPKSYSYSQEQAMGSGSGSSKEQLVQLPVRSSTEPVASSKSATQNHPYLSSTSRSTQQQDPYGSGQSLVKPSPHHTERHERKRTTSQDTIEYDPRHRERDRERDKDRERDRDRVPRRDHRGQPAWPPASNSNEGTLHRSVQNVDNKMGPTTDTNGRLSSSTHPYSHQPHSTTPAYTYTSQAQQGTLGRSSRSKATGHSRAASDSHNMSQPPSNRVAVSGILSTPAPTKEQLPPSTPVQESQQLKSASTQTLTTKQSSRPPSTHSTGQDSKKKGGGLLSLFRSISNPSKARDPSSTSAPSQPEQRTGKLRRNSSTAKRPVADLEALKSPGSNTTKVVELPGTLPSHQQQYSYSTNATHGSYGTQRSRDTQNNQDAKPSNAQPRGFHPWKLLSKRHRTMSTASMDALDGTMVSLSTPDESVRSSATSGLYPPLRDPMEAAQEWRNQEEMDYHDRGTGRRRRPGVTFEEPEDKSDLEIPIPVSAIHQRPLATRRHSKLR